MWRLDLFIAAVTDVIMPNIVANHKNDIWLGRRCRDNGDDGEHIESIEAETERVAHLTTLSVLRVFTRNTPHPGKAKGLHEMMLLVAQFFVHFIDAFHFEVKNENEMCISF